MGVGVAGGTASVTATATVAGISGLVVEVQPTAAKHATKINAKGLSMVTL